MEIKIILFLGLILFGQINEGISGLLGIALLVLFFIRTWKEKKINLPKSAFYVIIAFLPIIALVTSIWSVDFGMALLGATKFLPTLAFVLLISQYSDDEREDIIYSIPFMAGTINLLCFVAYFTPLKDKLFDDGRFMGTFGYANAYALFLLFSFVILLWHRKSKNEKFFEPIIRIVAAVLTFTGIVLTGTRSVMVLAMISIIVYIVSALKEKNEKDSIMENKWIAVSGLGVTAALTVLGLILEKQDAITRYFNFKIHSASFMDRYVYWVDGIELIKQNLCGTGYRGYERVVPSLQTGNYDNMFIHNEVLQMAADFGVILAIVLALYFVVSFIKTAELSKPNVRIRNVMILSIALVIGLFDYSFQYISNLLILLLFINPQTVETVFEDKKTIAARKKQNKKDGKSEDFKNVKRKYINPELRDIAYDFLILLGCFTLWTGIAQTMELTKNYESAYSLYPWLTTAQETQINLYDESNEAELKYNTARKVLERTEYSPYSYLALSEEACAAQDYDTMSINGIKAMEKAKYEAKVYEYYLYMLNYSITALNQTGEQPEMLEELLSRTVGVGVAIDEIVANSNKNAKYMSIKPFVYIGGNFEDFIDQAAYIAQ